MKYSPFLIVGLLLANSLEAQRTKFIEADPGEVFVYKDDENGVREIEVFFPEGHDPKTASLPGIIMFHGGGWGGGTRKQFSNLCDYFASRGLVTATVTYLVAPTKGKKRYKGEGSRKRVCIIDAKSAIRWFKQNAKTLGIDPDKVIAGGGSAGGHIALLATNTPGLNDPNDSLEIDTDVVAYLLFNPALTITDSSDPEVDFTQQVDGELAPSIVFFGTNDKWYTEGWKAAEAKLDELGLSEVVDVQIAEGQSHAFFNKQPWMDITLIASDKFLQQQGLVEGDSTLAMPKSGEGLVEGEWN